MLLEMFCCYTWKVFETCHLKQSGYNKKPFKSKYFAAWWKITYTVENICLKFLLQIMKIKMKMFFAETVILQN